MSRHHSHIMLRSGMSAALSIAALSIAPRLALAQKLTLTVPDGTFYEIQTIPGYVPAVDKTNKTITARVQVTLHFLKVPDGYTVTKSDTLRVISGQDLGGVDPAIGFPTPPPSDATALQLSLNAATSHPANNDLFNAIDKYIKQKQTFLLSTRQSDLGADKPVATLSAGVIKQDNINVFGDQHNNSLRAKSLAWNGTFNIVPEFDASKLGNVTLLTHPERASDPKAETVSLLPETFVQQFRQYSRWTFRKVMVNVGAYTSADKKVSYPGIENIPMMEVDASCVVQAVLAQGQSVDFPIVSAVVPTLTGDAGSVADTTAATGGSGFANFLFSADTSSLFTPGTTPNIRPGLDFVVGTAIQNNDTPTFVGISYHASPREGEGEVPAKFLDIRRIAGVFGKTQGDYAATVFALGYRVHPSVTLFAGSAYNRNNSGTRFGPALGIAIPILDLISSKQTTPATPVDVSVQNGKSASNPPIVTSNAAILWTTDPVPPATPSGNSLLKGFTITITPSSGNPAILPIQDTNQSFWITWVPAGTITVTMGGMPVTITGPTAVEAGKAYQAYFDQVNKKVTIRAFVNPGS